MTVPDATRLTGDAYSTRLAHGGAAMPVDKTRFVQEGYQSKLARDVAVNQSGASELYRMGEKIGDRYEVSAIHHGEMGVVYGCFDHLTKLPRALKTVRARHAPDKQVLSMFENEAAIWISLEKHPYIVRAYVVEHFKNLPYVITEYVRGPEGMAGDLRGWLGHPRLTLPVAVAIALQIAQGMQHAVRKVPNLVHRDLKPGNILVNGDGKAMVTDFGLVDAADSGAGTPAYMSPEQWRENALDARSDIYAYGCILFEMFTAHRLFPALTERDWESAHLESTPAALATLVPELPSGIDRFVRRCLEKDPKARPHSWDEIVTFFAEWYHHLTGKAVIFDFSSLALDAVEWFVAGYSLGNLKHYEEANEAYDRALELDPNFAAAWNNKGNVLLDLKRYEEASKASDRALAIEQNVANMWLTKGNVLYWFKRYEEAIQAYDRALALDQNYSIAWYNKGNVLLDLKRYEEAIKAYDRALVLDPNHVGAWYNKGNVFHDLTRYEEAIQAYDRALALDPNYIDALYNKGNVLLTHKRYEDANHIYDQALAIDPNFAAAWNNKGNALLELKRYEEASKASDKALAIERNVAPMWLTKGNVLLNLGRYEEAIYAYDRALVINPNYFQVWLNKGITLDLFLKRNVDAIQAYDRALVIDPNHEFALSRRKLAADALKAEK